MKGLGTGKMAMSQNSGTIGAQSHSWLMTVYSPKYGKMQ